MTGPRPAAPVTAARGVAVLDLGKPTEAASHHAAARLRLLLRLHGDPIGTVDLETPPPCLDAREVLNGFLARPASVALIEVLARRAARLGGGVSSDRVGAAWDACTSPATSGHAECSLTVAVCTRERPDSLTQTLDSLRVSAGGGVEILVVDNAPASTRTCELQQSRFPWVRYVREDLRGLNRARNRALRESTSEVVAFIDDDAVADRRWVAELRRLFGANPDVSVATGLVEAAALETDAMWWFERYGGFARGYRRRWIHVPRAPRRSIAFAYANTGRFGTGTNLAVRRAHALTLGGFDPALDVGTLTNAGGDLEMMFRFLKAGALLAYNPAAIVFHQHRTSYEALETQIERWGNGMAAHLARTSRACRDERLAVTLLQWWLYLSWFARRWVASWLDPRFPRALIVREWRGSLRGGRLYRRASAGLPPPGRPPALHGAPHRPGRVVRRTVELLEECSVIECDAHGRLLLTVTHNGRALGELNLHVVGGAVGADRWLDAAAWQFRHQLLGATDNEVLARVRRLVRERTGR